MGNGIPHFERVVILKSLIVPKENWTVLKMSKLS